MNAYNMNTKTTLFVVASVFVGFLAIGTPYTQYYSVGQAYIVEGISDTKEVEYYQITEEQYKADPLNENPRTTVKNGKTYNPEKAYRIEVWSTNPDATSGNWLPSGSYVVQDMGTKSTEDDTYIVCHSGKDCRGNKNLIFYEQGETPDLRATLESPLAGLIKTSYAAIAHENTGNSGTIPAASVSSISFSYTTPVVTDPFLIVCANQSELTTDGNLPITSMTYGGASTTEIASITGPFFGSTFVRTGQWYLQNAPTGSSTMVINYTGTVQYAYAQVSTYSGVDATTPIDSIFSSSVINTPVYSPGIVSTTTEAYISDCKNMSRTLFDNNTMSVESPGILRDATSFIGYNYGVANIQATTTNTFNRWICVEDSNCAATDWTSVLVALTQGEAGEITHVYNQLFE